jgi:voltage-gated potassium channel
MEEVTIPPGSPVSGLTIREADLGERAGVTLVMVQRPAKAETHPPTPGLRLEVGDILLALGTREQVQRLERAAQAEATGARG